MMDISLYLVRK